MQDLEYSEEDARVDTITPGRMAELRKQADEFLNQPVKHFPAEERAWEIERDRYGLMFSGPLEVGECRQVVPVTERERLQDRVDELEMLLVRVLQHGFDTPPLSGEIAKALAEALCR